VTVRVASHVYCEQDGPPYEEETVTLTVTVTDGVATTNGDARPVATSVHEEHPVDGAEYERYVSASFADNDGYVRSVVLDWGDGSAPKTFTNDAECDDGGGKHFPHAARFAVHARHTYAEPGDYRVTLTFVSTGCGGADRQQRSVEEAVTVL
jgi:PKD repeat protein